MFVRQVTCVFQQISTLDISPGRGLQHPAQEVNSRYEVRHMNAQIQQSTNTEDTPVGRLAAHLREKYGHRLLVQEAAAELRRSPAGLQYILASSRRRQAQWVQRLLRGRTRMGRRVLFSVEAVADCLVHGDEPIDDADTEGGAV